MKVKFYTISVLAVGIASLIVWQNIRQQNLADRRKKSGSELAGAVIHTPTLEHPASPAPVRTGNHVSYSRIEDAPTWTVRYGGEFWHAESQTGPTSANQGAPSGINLHQIIDRVSHAIARDAEELTVQDRSYVAKFESDGFTISPKRIACENAKTDRAVLSGPPVIEVEPVKARFKTRGVQNGFVELYGADSEAGDWSVTGNTAQRQLNEAHGLIEHYAAKTHGVEVTWVLSKAPPTSDPLTIESELSGVSFLGRDEKGLLFGEMDSRTAKFRASDVTVVDAAGTRTALPLAIKGDLLQVEIPSIVLASAHYPLAIDPLIGPAIPISYSMQTNAQDWAAVAGNGTNYLVVWSDLRDDPTLDNTADVWGTRVSPSGIVLEPAGIRLTTNTSELPRVASCGGNWLVVWRDGRNGDNGADIYGARVSGGGSVLDADGIGICTHTNSQSMPDVAANGTNYLVVWSDTRAYHSEDGYNIYGGRVTTGGATLDGDGFPISQLTADQGNPKVASDGIDFVVTWSETWASDYAGAMARRVLSNGTTSGSEFVIRAGSGIPAIAWSPAATNYLVVYPYDGQVRGNRLSQTGSLLDGTTGFTIDSSTITGSTAVGCNGNDYLVTWNEGQYMIFGARVSASDATVFEPDGFSIAPTGPQYFGFPAVGNVGTNYLVVWNEGTEVDYDLGDIWGGIVLGNGTVAAISPLSTDGSIATEPQQFAITAGSSGNYCLAWQDRRNDVGDIYAAIINNHGVVYQPSGIAVCVTNNYQWRVALAASGDQYFAVWQDSRVGAGAAYGARIDTTYNNGTLLDTNGFLIQPAPIALPSVCASGTNYLVVWSSGGVHGKRVTTAGTVIDATAITISGSTGSPSGVDISSIGTNWLATWFVSPSGTVDIYANRVTSAGTVLDGNGFAVSTATSHQTYPRVANNGTNYVIVWADTRNGGSDIYGARVSAGGTVLDTSGVAICTASTNQIFPAIASDGADFLVAWADYRGGLYANRLNAAGSILDGDGFIVDAGADVFPNYNTRPSVASVALNTYRLAYRAYGVGYSRTITTP